MPFRHMQPKKEHKIAETGWSADARLVSSRTKTKGPVLYE